MAETEKNVNGIMEKLALITDATQSMFPKILKSKPGIHALKGGCLL